MNLKHFALATIVAALPLRAQAPAARTPNEHGRIPILEYHLVGDKDSRWGRSRERFRDRKSTRLNSSH